MNPQVSQDSLATFCALQLNTVMYFFIQKYSQPVEMNSFTCYSGFLVTSHWQCSFYTAAVKIHFTLLCSTRTGQESGFISWFFIRIKRPLKPELSVSKFWPLCVQFPFITSTRSHGPLSPPVVVLLELFPLPVSEMILLLIVGRGAWWTPTTPT